MFFTTTYIFFSFTSISQTHKLCLQHIGYCTSDYASQLSIIKKEEDSLKIKDEGCIFGDVIISNHYIEGKQFDSLDRLIRNDVFFRPFLLNNKTDSALFDNLNEIDKFPTGTYLITSYNEKCEINYQYIFLGANKTVEMFEYIKTKILNETKDWNALFEINTLVIEICNDFMKNNH